MKKITALLALAALPVLLWGQSGYQSVKKNGKYGMLDSKGNLVVPCVYSWVGTGDLDVYKDRYFRVKQKDGENEKEGLYDIELKREAIPCVYYGVGLFNVYNVYKDRYLKVYQKDGENWLDGWYDIELKREAIPCGKYAVLLEVSENLVAVNIGGP